MITANNVELRAGARLLLSECTFRVGPGDRVGLVGRNGAGKTTLTKVLASEANPASGTVSPGPEPSATCRRTRARATSTCSAATASCPPVGSTRSPSDIAKLTIQLSESPDDEKALARYGKLEDRFSTLGGYAAEADAARIAANLGLPDRALAQPLHTLSGGQRRRIELARILFSEAGDGGTLLLDEPTNHLDADSVVWLRDYLRTHTGGLVVISHDVALLEATVNRVFHLDATRGVIDIYNIGWKRYLAQRESDEKRRKRERANAEKQAGVLSDQANRMRAKATKAKAAQGMLKRAEKMLVRP